jgi:hypothetical protein
LFRLNLRFRSFLMSPLNPTFLMSLRFRSFLKNHLSHLHLMCLKSLQNPMCLKNLRYRLFRLSL